MNLFKLYEYDSKNLQFNRVPLSVWLSKLLLFTLITTFLVVVFISDNKTIVEKIPILIYKDYHAISKEKLEEKLVEFNVSHKEIVIAQALLESAHFSSPIFEKNNNIFGMKEAVTRPTTALGTQLNHAYYKDWESSVLDYALWQTSFARNLSEEQYLNLLDKMYAEDAKYKDKILTMLKNLRNEKI